MTRKTKVRPFGGKMVHLRHPGSVKKAQEGAKMHNIDGDNPDRVFDAECDIRMDFDTNEYPNIFVSIK